MTKLLKFYKETNGEWFVDLPEFEGDKSEVQMVCGADTMLDILSQGEDNIWLTLSTEKLDHKCLLELTVVCEDIGFDTFDFENMSTSGAFYLAKTISNIDYQLSVWLCDVTKLVFGSFPEKIYIF